MTSTFHGKPLAEALDYVISIDYTQSYSDKFQNIGESSKGLGKSNGKLEISVVQGFPEGFSGFFEKFLGNSDLYSIETRFLTF